ncbi:hypothetical protein [Amphritea japonica]|uniref:Lipoprotein n=1 Tax=Amphritea japonica ATCC BAA-1530 TaxID=1278309 RepID=A0A7R6P937_9GAMM|nr:hypothetical protein [Amphritea japonica]BBB25103.1 hypothetical protein AMJAP_0504 [Amphritea japonica ATCC BAA-1530]
MKLNTYGMFPAVVAIIFVSFLTACSTQTMQLSGANNHLSSPKEGSVLPVDVSALLTDSMRDVSLLLSSGPNQGRNMTAGIPYFAASGRLCRKVVLIGEGVVDNYIACKIESTVWILRQAVI